MKCPLIHYRNPDPDVYPEEVFEDCLEEECAWWSPLTGSCAIRDLSGLLITIGNILGKLHDVLNSRLK